MGFLRTISTTTAVTTTAAALALNSLAPSSTSSSSYNYNFTKPFLNSSSPASSRFGLMKTLAAPPPALHMDAKPALKHDAELPEVMTEFMVDMSCEGCVKAVKNKLQTVDGIKTIDVDLSNQVVRIFGSSPVKIMAEALEQTGRKARLIGQGSPGDVFISAAVAEFKGPEIFGVVRLAQVSMELARIEANFSGLSPGKHAWSINEFGDLTRGAASTGKLFNPIKQQLSDEKALGDLGTLDVDEKGEAFFSGVKHNLTIGDLVGRAIAVYESEDRSDTGLAAAVIARSAGVGENYKKLCTCDGTTIWEATNADYVTSKV
ncbi:copper chaperone for superoxide dismutase, chloroplastic/cytosolic isoform X2 [Cynara cardunculus var. scolymus]|uniref:copper chaperone for superoxide dismutase, chloroplastic/cytosolic isoform X2 n=1 Tax=Cynara cardunculus var. scolymus TaxID=59895 RepID=UPI000D630DAB|nr:copper chaperone for superoxide dismutase, chloroplastic/cytosolic isoform X2 [Cynara cardunculus var. scolymus]